MFKYLGIFVLSFYSLLVNADERCKDLEPLKILVSEVAVADFKFNFVRLAELNERNQWQDPSCFESQLFVHDEAVRFELDDLQRMEKTSIFTEIMRSKIFQMSVLPAEHGEFVIFQGNGGGSQSAFFRTYQISDNSLKIIAADGYAGDMDFFVNGDTLHMNYSQYDHDSEEAKCSACTPIIKVDKSFKLQ